MAIVGFIGKKLGMTQLNKEEGISIPVTVLEIQPHVIVQVKTPQNDGYCALQVTTGRGFLKRMNKAELGHFSKAGIEPGRGLWEFRIPGDLFEEKDWAPGFSWGLEGLAVGQKVDVQGLTKGRGFAGTVKRHHFRTQDATHGNSLSHRVPGSIGQNQTPGRVFKGKKMSGRLGNDTRTTHNLTIARVDVSLGVLLLKGAVPGAPGGDVLVLSPGKGISRMLVENVGEEV